MGLKISEKGQENMLVTKSMSDVVLSDKVYYNVLLDNSVLCRDDVILHNSDNLNVIKQ